MQPAHNDSTKGRHPTQPLNKEQRANAAESARFSTCFYCRKVGRLWRQSLGSGVHNRLEHASKGASLLKAEQNLHKLSDWFGHDKKGSQHHRYNPSLN
eukprot:4569637-Amphidinium_carterae.1